MEIAELKKQIKENKFNPFYVFYGSEWKIQEMYLEKMGEVIGNRIYADSFSDIYSKLKAPSFFSRRTLYIVRDDKDLQSDEQLLQRLHSIIGDNVLVLLVLSPDKRTKLYRMYQTSFVEFNALKTAYLRSYLKCEIDMDSNNLDMLIEICENDLGRTLLEIDKIKKFGLDDYDTAFKTLLMDGTIYEPPVCGADTLAEEIIKGKVNNVYDVLEQCIESGIATLTMLTYLYNSVRDTLQVTACISKDICKSTGLPNWRVYKAKEKVGYRSETELVNMLKLIHKVETGIKTGKVEDSMAMEYLLVNIL